MLSWMKASSTSVALLVLGLSWGTVAGAFMVFFPRAMLDMSRSDRRRHRDLSFGPLVFPPREEKHLRVQGALVILAATLIFGLPLALHLFANN